MSGQTKAEESVAELDSEKPYCGIIMPIAPMPGYEGTHWSRVREIIDRAILQAGYQPRLVSESEDIGVIHARIVQNLYDDEIVVCDVSGKNANVMFELGIRLAFDKPTIIVKDDETGYSFDTSPIEHIPYRKDQRFDDVEKFSTKLTDAIQKTIAKTKKSSGFSPFLGHFARIKPSKIDSKEVSSNDFVLARLDAIESRILGLGRRIESRQKLDTEVVFDDAVQAWRNVGRRRMLEVEPILDDVRSFAFEILGREKSPVSEKSWVSIQGSLKKFLVSRYPMLSMGEIDFIQEKLLLEMRTTQFADQRS